MFALQPELKVFTGSANRDLAERICKYIGVPLGQATISAFPDSETYVRIEENIRGHDVFIVQPTSPPTNQHCRHRNDCAGRYRPPPSPVAAGRGREVLQRLLRRVR